MPFVISLTLLLLGFACWYLLTAPRRRADHLLRILSQTLGVPLLNRHLTGTMPWMPHQAQMWQLSIYPVDFLGNRMGIRWSSLWPADHLRPTWHPQSQQLILISNHRSQPHRSPCTETAGKIAVFLRYPRFTNPTLRTEGSFLIGEACFSSTEIQFPQLAGWTHLITSIGSTLLAESSPQIAFLSKQQAPPRSSGQCQICGVDVQASQQVQCAKCGAPHHAECWQYNGGCAIFGCRSTQSNRPQIQPPSRVPSLRR